MKGISSHMTKGLHVGSLVGTCDNSGAKIVRIISVKTYKGIMRRTPKAGIGDYVWVVVVKGKPDMRKKIVPAVIVRQRRPYRRPSGERLKFEDNAVVILKEDKANSPKGTIFKGPIAKESIERWPAIATIAKIVI